MRIEFTRRHVILFIVILFAQAIAVTLTLLRMEVDYLPDFVWLMILSGLTGSSFLRTVIIFQLVDVFRRKR